MLARELIDIYPVLRTDQNVFPPFSNTEITPLKWICSSRAYYSSIIVILPIAVVGWRLKFTVSQDIGSTCSITAFRYRSLEKNELFSSDNSDFSYLIT